MVTNGGSDPPDASVGEVTRLLRALGQGDRSAEDELYAIVYAELRTLARRYVGPDDTLQPTALVHEAFVRLARGDDVQASRLHFFGVAAKTMRRIAVDEHRRRNALKRGGKQEQATQTAGRDAPAPSEPELDHLALDDALQQLEALSPEQVRVAELRIYAGLGVSECAESLGISTATVERRWRSAQAFLRSRLGAS